MIALGHNGQYIYFLIRLDSFMVFYLFFLPIYIIIYFTYKKSKNNTLFSLVSAMQLNKESITNTDEALFFMTP